MTEWYRNSWNYAVKKLNSNAEKGLKSSEIDLIRESSGSNEISIPKSKSIFYYILLEIKQWWFLVNIINIVLSIYLKNFTIAIVNFSIILIGEILLQCKKYKEEKSTHYLKTLQPPFCNVLRDGRIIRLSSDELVLGDIVFIEKNSIIPADIRIISAEDLKVKETTVTGDERVIEKYSTKIEDVEIQLGDMKNILFKSSVVVDGSGTGIVIETGMNTQIGQIISIVNKQKDNSNIVSQQLFSKIDVFSLYVFFAGAVVLSFVYSSTRSLTYSLKLFNYILTSGTPVTSLLIVFTYINFTLARLSSSGIKINKISVIEKLPKITAIFAEKKGLISTEKEILIKGYTNDETFEFLPNNIEKNDNIERMMNIALLTSNIKISIRENTIRGNNEELAFIKCAQDLKFDIEDIIYGYKRIFYIPMSYESMVCTSVNRVYKKYRANVKGAVEEVLGKCTHIMKNGIEKEITEEDIENIKEADIKMAVNTLKVEALAYRSFTYEPSESENIESNLVFVGLIGLYNPLETQSNLWIKEGNALGIIPYISTEENKLTAISSAKELKIFIKNEGVLSGVELDHIDDNELKRNIHIINVFSRIKWEHKIRIVNCLKEIGQKVLMTGNTLNDLTAMKNSYVNVAYGKKCDKILQTLADIIITNGTYRDLLSLIEKSKVVSSSYGELIKYLISCSSQQLTFIILIALSGVKGINILVLMFIGIVIPIVGSILIFIEDEDSNGIKPMISYSTSLIFGIVAFISYKYTGYNVFALLAISILILTLNFTKKLWTYVVIIVGMFIAATFVNYNFQILRTLLEFIAIDYAIILISKFFIDD